MSMTVFARARHALFLACAVVCTAAHAQAADDLASGFASLSNVAFKLVDLAPQSGQAPWIQFGQPWPFGEPTPVQGWAYSSGQVLRDAQTGNAVTPYWQETYFNAPLPLSQTQIGATDGTGSVSLNASGMSATMRVGPDALSKAVTWDGGERKVYQVDNVATSGDYLRYPIPRWDSTFATVTVDEPQGPMLQSVQFTLSAHTQVTLEADASAQVSLRPGQMLEWDDPNATFNPSVYAGVTLSLSRATPSFSLAGTYESYEQYMDAVRSAYAWNYDWISAQGSLDPAMMAPDARHLSVSLVNDSDQEMTGVFVLSASAGAALYAPVDAVPEPSTCLLMGLGLVGMAWRRRRAA